MPPLRGLTARFQTDYLNGIDATGAALPTPSQGGRVALWRDRYAGQWVLAQASGVAQASLRAAAFTTGAGGAVFAAGQSIEGAINWLSTRGYPCALAVILRGVSDTGPALQEIAGWGGPVGTEPLAQFSLCLARQGGGGLGFAIDLGGTLVGPTADVIGSGAWLILATYDGTTVTLRTVPATGAGSTTSMALALTTWNAGFYIGRNGNLAATVGEVLAYVDVPTPDEITTLLAYASAQYGVSGS